MDMDMVTFEPDPDAMDLAERMMDANETMQTILEETLASAKDGRILESGRTTCGDERTLRGPLQRFPTSVELQECPVGLAGSWHTHVTPDELLHPTLSIPDMGNVVFGHMDVFAVVGAKSADVMVAAEDREEMVEAFQNVLGIEAESVMDVIEALEDERIGDPASARQRLRERFAALLMTEQTGYDDLADTIERATEQMATDSLVAAHPDRGLYDLGDDSGERNREAHSKPFIEAHNERLKERARVGRVLAAQTTSGINLQQLIVSTIIGNIVGNLVDNYLMP